MNENSSNVQDEFYEEIDQKSIENI